MAPWCLVSPASRGIGFALARQVLKETKAPVVATVRKGDVLMMRDEILKGIEGVDGRRLSVLKMDFLGIATILYPIHSDSEDKKEDIVDYFLIWPHRRNIN